MSKIPDFVTILGQKWAVALSEILDNDPDIMGLCVPESRTVFLKSSLSYECAVEVLFHEVLHCYASVLPLPVKNKHEEALAQFFAGIMVDLVKNNDPWWEDAEDLNNQMPSETH